jgi:hypothetical protein
MLFESFNELLIWSSFVFIKLILLVLSHICNKLSIVKAVFVIQYFQFIFAMIKELDHYELSVQGFVIIFHQVIFNELFSNVVACSGSFCLILAFQI